MMQRVFMPVVARALGLASHPVVFKLFVALAALVRSPALDPLGHTALALAFVLCFAVFIVALMLSGLAITTMLAWVGVLLVSILASLAATVLSRRWKTALWIVGIFSICWTVLQWPPGPDSGPVPTDPPKQPIDYTGTPYAQFGVDVYSSKAEIVQAVSATLQEKPLFSTIIGGMSPPQMEALRRYSEILTDPLQRCVYHKDTGRPDWYGVPRFCWSEAVLGKLTTTVEPSAALSPSATA
jgi:hypothetical protein